MVSAGRYVKSYRISRTYPSFLRIGYSMVQKRS